MGLVIGLLIECSNGSNGSNDISGGFHGDVRPVMVPLPWMRVTPTTFSETPNLLRTCQSVESNQPIQPSDDFGTLPCLNLPGLRSCKACNVMLFLKDNHLCACKIYIYLYSLYIYSWQSGPSWKNVTMICSGSRLSAQVQQEYDQHQNPQWFHGRFLHPWESYRH